MAKRAQPPSTPSNVISLSAYRAQLGPGKRLRRADELLGAADPAAAIAALPGDELYYVLHEAGLTESVDVLAHATAAQVQVALDFDVWDGDRVSAPRLGVWLDVLAEAPPEKIAAWLAGLDVELVGLLLTRGARIFDLSQEEPPDEPEGQLFPTPDRLFVIDVRPGVHGSPDEAPGPVARLLDALYRHDADFARRLLIGVRSELPSELEETSFRWRSGRMADLGFVDYYDALEIYRELDPAAVRVGEPILGATPRRARGGGKTVNSDAVAPGAALRAPVALIEPLGGGGPFARAASALTHDTEIADLHAALVGLCNRVLAADRVAPHDDDLVRELLARLHATLDLAVEWMTRPQPQPPSGARAEVRLEGVDVVRSVPLPRLFRVGVSLIGKVRGLAQALRRGDPYARLQPAFDLHEPEDAAVMAAVDRLRPVYPRLLDKPPAGGERPFGSLADLARAAAAIERAGAALAMLHGLGVRAEDVAPACAGMEPELVDAGVLARTAIGLRLLGETATSFRALDPAEVEKLNKFLVNRTNKLILKEKTSAFVSSVLAAAAPAALARAGVAAVCARWMASLAPPERMIVRRAETPAARPIARPRSPRRGPRQGRRRRN